MTTNDTATAETTTRREFSPRLLAFGNRIRRLLALRGLVIFLAWTVGLALLTYLLDRVLKLSVTARTIVGLAALFWMLRIAWLELLAPMRGPWNTMTLAAALDRLGVSASGRARSEILQRHATVEQLGPRIDAPGPDDSPELLRAAVETSRKELEAVDLSGLVDHRRRNRRILMLAALILLPVGAALAAPETFSLWFKRWFLASEEKWPQETYLEVQGLENGRLIVPRAESFELRVRARDDSKVPNRVDIQYRIDDGPKITETMTSFGENDFRFQMPVVRKDAEIWVTGNDDRVGPIPVEAHDRPRIISYRLRAALDSRGLEETLEFERQDQALAFLKNTKIDLDLQANQPVSAITLPREQSQSVLCKKVGPDRERLSWTHLRRRSFTLELVSTETGLRSRPSSLDIALKEDTAPRVTVTVTGVRDRITPTADIPISVLAQDDYGLANLAIEISAGLRSEPGESDRKRKSKVFEAEAETQTAETSYEHEELVKVAPLKVKVGEFVRISGLAEDRSHLGAQQGRSRARVFRVVSPEQLFREIALRLQRSRGRFRKAFEQAKAVAAILKENEQLNDLEDALRLTRLVERQSWSTDRVFSASVRELVLNKLVEREAEALLSRKVLLPLQRLHRVTLKEQRERMDRFGSADAGAPGLEELRAGQDRVVAEMKRVLDGMKQWDSFVDLINQLNEVIKLQQGVRSETLDANEGK